MGVVTPQPFVDGHLQIVGEHDLTYGEVASIAGSLLTPSLSRVVGVQSIECQRRPIERKWRNLNRTCAVSRETLLLRVVANTMESRREVTV
jgi:hypothetical protein